MPTTEPSATSQRRRWTRRALVAVLLAAGGFFFIRNLYGFLAIPTCRVDADVLVVEGWGGASMLRAAVSEYQQGHYSLVVVAASETGQDADEEEPLALQAAEELAGMGVPRPKIIVAAPVTDGWNKTAKAARDACARLREAGIRPKGLNVVTRGPHARRSRLAYQHAIGPETPVGIVTVPLKRYENRAWWTSRSGIFLMAKNFAGWLRECLAG